jgi:DNA polymerase-3 subunit epsilon
MNRQIVLDTETTGISAQLGHRIIEIGCVELINRQLTSNFFHVYLNPDREVDEGAFRVHGISTEFLKDKPRFSEIAGDFLTFIAGSELIIHNATFDVGFLDAELNRLKRPPLLSHDTSVFDTLAYARQKHKGARNNLDALCKRYQIDNTHRKHHGALLDAEILAAVYLAMTGGQIELFSFASDEEQQTKAALSQEHPLLQSNSPVIKASAEELSAHQAFIEFLVKTSKVDRWE